MLTEADRTKMLPDDFHPAALRDLPPVLAHSGKAEEHFGRSSMKLTSSAFSARDKVPTRFTCDGTDISPPLAWSDAPQGTRSFALVCSDPDAPSGVWFHWAIFDIQGGSDHLAEHHAKNSPGSRQARNDFGFSGYGGPCPPRGHGRHHYHFKLYALDVTKLDLPATADCREVERAAQSHALATAELIGVYSR